MSQIRTPAWRVGTSMRAFRVAMHPPTLRQKLALGLLMVLVLLILPGAVLVGYLGITSMEDFWASALFPMYRLPHW
jgi:hypothetical protein